jgi:asparagine synthase (glutamine-hydrolysing)
MERSLTFLLAHQNPADGRLPNYGANDGSLPGLLSTCDFPDFRPLLQTLSVIVRGERLYQPGPWDEMPLWFVGPGALDLPIRPPSRTSVSFAPTGYHVLRGSDESSFCAFRCGSVRDRFSQIDMLHLDVWWRGLNVLTDGGSYLYNGPHVWHEHFMRTGSHNTIELDGRDQMLHFRQFKTLYWTRASLCKFEERPGCAVIEGEHFGYQRHRGGCVHRRSVMFAKDDLWVVVDHISGSGHHSARLHWLAGEFPWTDTESGLELTTPEGRFSVSILDCDGHPKPHTTAAGVVAPPRGWLSRYYGEKTAVPSLVVEQRAELPLTMVTILSGAAYTASVDEGRWALRLNDGGVTFALADGRIDSISIQ